MTGEQPMLIRPFCRIGPLSDPVPMEFDRQGTHEVVVLAADGLLDAVGARADANDRDRGASQADEHIDALDNNAEQAKKSGSARTVSLNE